MTPILDLCSSVGTHELYSVRSVPPFNRTYEASIVHRFTVGTVGYKACTPSGTNEVPGHRRLRLNHQVTQLVDEGSAEKCK